MNMERSWVERKLEIEVFTGNNEALGKRLRNESLRIGPIVGELLVRTKYFMVLKNVTDMREVNNKWADFMQRVKNAID